MTGMADALADATDRSLEPIWNRSTGEFTWGLGLSEAHPRGQYNAVLAAAEAVTEGAWSRLATTTGGTRFEEPTATGVDFPRVSLNRAWWDARRGQLSLQTVGQHEGVDGTLTTFLISEVGDPASWEVKRATEQTNPAPSYR